MVIKVIEVLIIVTCKSPYCISTIIRSQTITSELVRTSRSPFCGEFSVSQIWMFIIHHHFNTYWIFIKSLSSYNNSIVIAIIRLWNTICMERKARTLYISICMKTYCKRTCFGRNSGIICYTRYRRITIKKSLLQYMTICALNIRRCCCIYAIIAVIARMSCTSMPCSRISVSVKSTAPQYLATSTFAIVYCYIIMLPIKRIFTIKIKNCTRSSWTQNNVFVIEVSRIISTGTTIIVNRSVTSDVWVMRTARTRHINIIGAIDGYRSRPSARLR